ncbi:MAG: DUF1786 domain-containing protein [Bacillota bacterium]|nr:DUF1786 domain-containing protein [Bacillota bacterium]
MYQKSVLAIDIGGGTQDILLYDPNKNIENCPKLVLPSPTMLLKGSIEKATKNEKDIFLTGPIMGGGPSVRGIRNHLSAGLKVFATASAAKTIFDDLRRVQDMGVIITDRQPANTQIIKTGDLDLPKLKQVLELYQLPFPQEIAVCVQDHGEAVGVSNRQVRSNAWESFILAGGNPLSLIYRRVPSHLTRMLAVKEAYPPAVLMDTGPAAIIGALSDSHVASYERKGLTVVNVGNMHTLAFLIKDNKIWGMFEHHTSMLNPTKLAALVQKLQQGNILQQDIYDDGGHGGTIHPDSLPSAFDFIAVTGPNRSMAATLNPYYPAPYGDMMLTGCFGLIKALASLDRE